MYMDVYIYIFLFCWSNQRRSEYFEINWSVNEFGFRFLFIYLFLLLHVFLTSESSSRS